MDKAILDFIADHLRAGWLNGIMKVFTLLGELGIFGLTCGIVCLIFKKYRRVGFAILICMAIGFLVGNLFLKNIIARDRPCVTFDYLTYYIKCPNEYSMPSGHTLHSFIPVFLLFYFKKWKVGIPTLIIACLIAFSRMYFAVHYPSDILVAITLAFVLSTVVYICLNRIPKLKNLFLYKE